MNSRKALASFPDFLISQFVFWLRPFRTASLRFIPLLLCAVAPPLVAADLDQAITAAATYQSGLSAEPLSQIEALVRESAGHAAQRQQLEAALVKLLAPTATFEARRFACNELAIIGTDASLPALAGLLKNEETVGMACFALGSQPSKKANEILRAALATARGLTLAQIINTLGDRGDADAVKLLVPFTRDADDLVTDAAISALGKIATPAALAELAPLRQKGDLALSRAATAASLAAADKIARAGDRKTAISLYEGLLAPVQPVFVRRAAVVGLARLEKESAAPRLLEILRGPDAAVKPAAIAAIRSLSAADTSEKFAKELPKLQPAEQALMIEILAARGDAAAKKTIHDNLTAENPVVRMAAISALGVVGDPSSVGQLVKALADAKNPDESQPAETALTSLPGGDKTDAAIVAQMGQAPKETKTRLIAILAKRGSHVAVPALLEQTADPVAAKAAFRALGRMAGPQDLPTLLAKLTNLQVPDARAAAEGAVAQTLTKVQDEAARTSAVCGALDKTSDVETRCSLLALLPTCEGARALAALKSARADQEPLVRETAVRALADWPDASAWDTLVEIQAQPENDAQRVLVLRGLVRLAGEENAKPGPALIDRYRALLAGAKNDDDRKLILGTLAGCAHPDALPLALPLVANAGLKAEATLAVKKIAQAIKTTHPQEAQEALKKVK